MTKKERKAVRGLGKPARRIKAPGSVTPEVRDLVLRRANTKCERCGRSLEGTMYSIHHRLPRGMGGSRVPWLHLPGNLVALCGSGTSGCHGWVESHRLQAFNQGLLVYQNQVSAEVAVWVRGRYVYLADDGGYLQFPY